MVFGQKKVARLFGVGHYDETDAFSIKHQSAWLERRKRLLTRRCGPLIDECEPKDATHVSRFLRRAKHVATSSTASVDQITTSERPITTTNFTAIDDASVENMHDKTEMSFKHIIKPATVAFPIDRTTSDTGKPQHLDDVSHGSYDLTDFDARESVAKLVNDILARHQPKRVFGMGLVGNLLSRKFRKDLTSAQINAIHSFNDHRPYFTYWVTTVQILIMIITLFTYGFGPFGIGSKLIDETVLVPTIALHQEAYPQDRNIWLGPRPQDLIHLGAKFTPCMRKDSLIYKAIEQDREEERSTGCCIKTDGSGCWQTKKKDCSQLWNWHSWNETAIDSRANPKHRISGPVCGQDPEYCLRPASTPPREWPDDITQWPICLEREVSHEKLHHMSCNVTSVPCCIGINGQCRITTTEHCRFLRGTSHPEARLCSQVYCMEDVCGMVPFYAHDHPDQFYRLVTALFLHAGLIHLSFTIILQLYIMRDIERLLGSTRMGLIYILPGIAGYLASATFVPYHTQVGPSGSHFALLASLMAETINSWKLLEYPASSLGKLISIAIGLFVLGLLPWIDNYAHIFGFLVGLMLSLALTPYLTPFSDAYSRRIKVVQLWICISLVILTFVLLTMSLYVFPLYECSWCQYLDCWPLALDWCKDHDIKVTRLDNRIY